MKNRWQILNKPLFLALIALMMLNLYLFNMAVLRLSNRHSLFIDLTASRAYQLDEESIALLDSLEAPVHIDVLATEDSFEGSPYLRQARQILNRYPAQSDLVSLAYIDYQKDPSFAASYPDLSLSPGSILVTSGDNQRLLTLKELFNYTYSDAGQGGMTVASSRAQEAVSSAILQVTSGQKTRAAVLTGAGTAQMNALSSLLLDNNCQVEQKNIVSGDLSGFDVLLLLAPTVDLSEDSLKRLDDFLYNEGRYGKALVYAMDASQPSLPKMEAFLAEWGILPLDGAVFETRQQMTYSMQPYYPLSEYRDEEIAGKLRDRSIPVLMPRAKPYSVLFTARDRQQTRELMAFSETSGVRPGQAGSDFVPDKAAIRGPLPAMTLASRVVRDKETGQVFASHLIISASTAMLDAQWLQNPQLNNGEYLLKTLGSALDQAQGVVIRPVSLASEALSLNSGTASLLGILFSAVIPGLLLLAGVAVFLYRRFQ